VSDGTEQGWRGLSGCVASYVSIRIVRSAGAKSTGNCLLKAVARSVACNALTTLKGV
jgi:hypothetical protein